MFGVWPQLAECEGGFRLLEGGAQTISQRGRNLLLISTLSGTMTDCPRSQTMSRVTPSPDAPRPSPLRLSPLTANSPLLTSSRASQSVSDALRAEIRPQIPSPERLSSPATALSPAPVRPTPIRRSPSRARRILRQAHREPQLNQRPRRIRLGPWELPSPDATAKRALIEM